MAIISIHEYYLNCTKTELLKPKQQMIEDTQSQKCKIDIINKHLNLIFNLKFIFVLDKKIFRQRKSF